LLLVTVTDFDALVVPIGVVPKFRVFGERLTASAPFPETLKTCGVTAELSFTQTAPLIVPFTVGLNVTEKVQVCVEASTSPLVQGVAPLATAEKSPLDAKELSVTEAPLVLVTVTDLAALLVPTSWLANERLVGVNVRGDAAPPVPLPESATSMGLDAALKLMVAAPLMVPFDLGVKVTEMVHLVFPASEALQGVVPLPGAL